MLAVGVARAADERYPVRPVHLMIPSIPGGVHDVVGRLWAERARSSFGTLVIDNHGGAGGYVGAVDVAHSKADGYTLLLGSTSTQVLVPAQIPNPRYDPARDFEVVGLFSSSLTSILVHPSIPARNLTELVAWARANPGKLIYGSTGMGSVTHMAGESFRRMAGVDVGHIPYKGLSQGITDLISGQIPMLTPNVTPQIIELHRSGRGRLLAVLGTNRLKAAPDIPTAAEAGMPGLLVPMFFGIFVPAGTPPAVIGVLEGINRKVAADESFQKVLIAGGFEPLTDVGAERGRRFVLDEINRWTPIMKATAARID
jgi:tripartite-type tricarboxylate transporter receptor subunit TctC